LNSLPHFSSPVKRGRRGFLGTAYLGMTAHFVTPSDSEESLLLRGRRFLGTACLGMTVKPLKNNGMTEKTVKEQH